MQEIRQCPDSHHEIPLSFRSQVEMPSNHSLALFRFQKLTRRMTVDSKYRADYLASMNRMIDNGHAEIVPDAEQHLAKWYLPHHGVYHPKKPGKLQVMFDASCQFRDHCLNDNLLPGPDLINSLVGILLHFRKERIAIMCDIEQMFHQFRVAEKHRDYLRFLWYDADLSNPPKDFRMTVHLFGARSSPGCSNFGLKQIAKDYGHLYAEEAATFVNRDFYVDDGLTSVPTEDEAISLVHDVTDMCAKGALKLHKFACNSDSVMEIIPPEARAESAKSLPETSNIERALGVLWCLQSDCFLFRIQIPERPLTRQGVLSINQLSI